MRLENVLEPVIVWLEVKSTKFAVEPLLIELMTPCASVVIDAKLYEDDGDTE